MDASFHDLAFRVVRASGARGVLAKEMQAEIESHILAAYNELLFEGLSPEEISQDIMRRFGDPECIGKSFNDVHHITMQKVLSLVIKIGVGIAALLIAATVLSSDNLLGFETAIQKKYGAYEPMMAYVKDVSAQPCATDGLGISPAPLGKIITWCDVSWYYGFGGMLVQTSGPALDPSMIDRYLSIPNDLHGNTILREIHRQFARGTVPEDITPPEESRASFTISRDYGEQTIQVAQIAKVFRLGNAEYMYVSQKNMNTPVFLNDGERIEFSGLLGRIMGEPYWTPLLDLTDAYRTNSGALLLEKPNVLSIFVSDDILYVDIVDAGGAGSGEGNILRLEFIGDIQDQVAKTDAAGAPWNTIQWHPVSCAYFIPETYVTGSWDLPPTDGCGAFPPPIFSDKENIIE